MKIIHVQTTIQTVFGVLDDDGNVVPQQPIVLRVQRFSADAFKEAQQAIADERNKIAANTDDLISTHKAKAEGI